MIAKNAPAVLKVKKWIDLLTLKTTLMSAALCRQKQD